MSKAPLHVLPGFVAAARMLNLSRAAASLHVTVSALSHQMRGLEELLGQRLFVRGPRGLRLTPAGDRLFGQVAPHLDAISAALAPQPARSPPHADPERDAERGLELAHSPAAVVHRRAPRGRAEPAVHGGPGGLRPGGGRRRAAVRAGRLAGPETHLLFEEWVVPVCSPDLLRRFPRIRQGDFSGVPLLRDHGGRWDAWFARFGGSPPARYVAAFDDTDALQRAAVEGMGVGLGRLTMARPLLESGRLVALTRHRLPTAARTTSSIPPGRRTIRRWWRSGPGCSTSSGRRRHGWLPTPRWPERHGPGRREVGDADGAGDRRNEAGQ